MISKALATNGSAGEVASLRPGASISRSNLHALTRAAAGEDVSAAIERSIALASKASGSASADAKASLLASARVGRPLRFGFFVVFIDHPVFWSFSFARA